MNVGHYISRNGQYWRYDKKKGYVRDMEVPPLLYSRYLGYEVAITRDGRLYVFGTKMIIDIGDHIISVTNISNMEDTMRYLALTQSNRLYYIIIKSDNFRYRVLKKNVEYLVGNASHASIMYANTNHWYHVEYNSNRKKYEFTAIVDQDDETPLPDGESLRNIGNVLMNNWGFYVTRYYEDDDTYYFKFIGDSSDIQLACEVEEGYDDENEIVAITDEGQLIMLGPEDEMGSEQIIRSDLSDKSKWVDLIMIRYNKASSATFHVINENDEIYTIKPSDDEDEEEGLDLIKVDVPVEVINGTD